MKHGILDGTALATAFVHVLTQLHYASLPLLLNRGLPASKKHFSSLMRICANFQAHSQACLKYRQDPYTSLQGLKILEISFYYRHRFSTSNALSLQVSSGEIFRLNAAFWLHPVPKRLSDIGMPVMRLSLTAEPGSPSRLFFSRWNTQFPFCFLPSSGTTGFASGITGSSPNLLFARRRLFSGALP
jgi:hypothetical protein